LEDLLRELKKTTLRSLDYTPAYRRQGFQKRIAKIYEISGLFQKSL
jgi:hypothetical protein